MNNKSIAYMLVAIVVGYTLVSAVPNQIAMYATPTPTMGTYEDSTYEGGDEISKTDEGERTFETPPNRDIEDVEPAAQQAAEAASAATEAVAATAGSADQSAAEAAEAAKAASGSRQTIGLMFWYSVDVLIAVGVYLVAKRKLN